MKNCPTCNRTYADDALTFCLMDGAVLSEPCDPHETLRIPASRSTDPAPTEVLHPLPKPADPSPSLPPTISSPQPPTFYSEKPQYQPQAKRINKSSLFIVVAVILGITFGVVITVSLMGLGKDKSEDSPSHSTPLNNNPVSTTTSSKPSSTSTKTSSCFNEDAGAGVKEREAHYSWAQQHDSTALGRNLMYKADLLFSCPEMDEDRLSSTFADISVAIARYVPDANCFGGDTGVITTNRPGHKEAFLNYPDRKERLLRNLKWKMVAGLKCLDRRRQSSFFADVSVLVANGPQ